MVDWSAPKEIENILSRPAKVWSAEDMRAIYGYIVHQHDKYDEHDPYEGKRKWYEYFISTARRDLYRYLGKQTDVDLNDDAEDVVNIMLEKYFTGENPSIYSYDPAKSQTESLESGVPIRNYFIGIIKKRCIDRFRKYVRERYGPQPKYDKDIKTKTEKSMFWSNYLAQDPNAKKTVGNIFDNLGDEPGSLSIFQAVTDQDDASIEDSLADLEDLRNEYESLYGLDPQIDNELDFSGDVATYRGQIQNLIDEEHLEILRECIGDLPQTHRYVARMRAGYHGAESQKNNNIARTLGLTPGHVAVIWNRLQKTLMQCAELKRRVL